MSPEFPLLGPAANKPPVANCIQLGLGLESSAGRRIRIDGGLTGVLQVSASGGA